MARPVTEECSAERVGYGFFMSWQVDIVGRLDGKVALVTGAARGIGWAIAHAFLREGAQVWLTDLEAVCVRDLGPAAHSTPLDVREEPHWLRVTAEILDSCGRLDVLVNNAGITGFEAGPLAHDPENATLESWHAVHRTNLDGVFLGCKHGIRAMRPRKTGSIINMSSRSGLVGVPGAAAYASSKAAVRNHTKSVALWCAQQGLAIRCNSVHPGAILTPLWEPMLGSGPEREARTAAFTRDIPARRFGTADEVAALAVLLASDEATFITGAEMSIDGGLLAGPAAPVDP
jgi:NAD(P)-dependent dehydrogenase (short-subunit alcohol dehydrogenase family)